MSFSIQEVLRRWFPHPSTICRRHADCRTKPEEDGKFEEGHEEVIRDEGRGTGEADPRDAHSPRSDEEAIVAVTREVREKGAPKVQHVGCETGWVDTTHQLQAVQEAKPENKDGQS